MKAFFDTSVLVATFFADHQHHDASIEVFLKFPKANASCGAHSLAEVYATLTRMPGRSRVSGDQAMLFLGTIRERLTVVSMTEDEYFTAIEEASAQGIVGGGIYDALLAQCALKVNAQVIYTWNLKHFQTLHSKVASRLQTP